MTEPTYVTPKQAKWFAKVRAGLETETGKTLDEWVVIAKTCPETTHKKRLKWFKDKYGLGVNRASTIIGAAFKTGMGWDNPEKLLDVLWKTPETRAVYDALEACAKSLGDDVIVGPRKTFSGFSKTYQFAAARPYRGQVRLGLALEPKLHKLDPAMTKEVWSYRLKSVVMLSKPDQVDNNLSKLMKMAHDAS